MAPFVGSCTAGRRKSIGQAGRSLVICTDCKTIIGWSEDEHSCDHCYRVWCDSCAEKDGFIVCPECGYISCYRCLIADYDPDTETYTGKILCQNCVGLVDFEKP